MAFFAGLLIRSLFQDENQCFAAEEKDKDSKEQFPIDLQAEYYVEKRLAGK
jgi:hypothetical protein